MYLDMTLYSLLCLVISGIGNLEAVIDLFGGNTLQQVTLNIPEFISRILDINPFEANDVIITARRLYQPANIKLPIQKYLELNRRFAEGFSHLKDEPEVHRIMSMYFPQKVTS
jgi:hypothetical protein